VTNYSYDWSAGTYPPYGMLVSTFYPDARSTYENYMRDFTTNQLCRWYRGDWSRDSIYCWTTFDEHENVTDCGGDLN
jgi:hypothetical protein